MFDGWDLAESGARKDAELAAASAVGAPAAVVELLRREWRNRAQACSAVGSDHREWVMVHDDLHFGNVVRLDGRLLLCDTDDMCRGPREADLAKMVFHLRRFRGDGGAMFLEAYPAPFDGRLVEVLRALREVSACVWLASLWQRRPDTRPQLRLRVAGLSSGGALWRPV